MMILIINFTYTDFYNMKSETEKTISDNITEKMMLQYTNLRNYMYNSQNYLSVTLFSQDIQRLDTYKTESSSNNKKFSNTDIMNVHKDIKDKLYNSLFMFNLAVKQTEDLIIMIRDKKYKQLIVPYTYDLSLLYNNNNNSITTTSTTSTSKSSTNSSENNVVQDLLSEVQILRITLENVLNTNTLPLSDSTTDNDNNIRTKYIDNVNNLIEYNNKKLTFFIAIQPEKK